MDERILQPPDRTLDRIWPLGRHRCRGAAWAAFIGLLALVVLVTSVVRLRGAARGAVEPVGHGFADEQAHAWVEVISRRPLAPSEVECVASANGTTWCRGAGWDDAWVACAGWERARGERACRLIESSGAITELRGLPPR